MARVRVLTMKFPRVTKIGQSIASMRTTPQVSGLGPVTVYIARFKCLAGLDPDRAYLFQLGSAHQKVAPGRARSTRLHCHLFCRAVLDPGRALSICGSVKVALQEVYSGNRQIHTKCQLQYFHPPHISTSGKCHCVIIHHTTNATEYTG